MVHFLPGWLKGTAQVSLC